MCLLVNWPITGTLSSTSSYDVIVTTYSISGISSVNKVSVVLAERVNSLVGPSGNIERKISMQQNFLTHNVIQYNVIPRYTQNLKIQNTHFFQNAQALFFTVLQN